MKFNAIEAARGIAAILVVFHHAGNILAKPRFYGVHPLDNAFEMFSVGVDFFFVLSGFIITWVHWNDFGHADRIGNYASKRFLRIYPPYWGILIPLVLLYALFPDAGIPSQHDTTNIAMSFLLLPYEMPPVLGVAWTLVFEIFFYALFAVILVIGRKGLWLIPLWVLAIIANTLFIKAPFPTEFFLSPFNLLFIMGVGTAVYLRNHQVPFPKFMAICGAVLFAIFLFVPAVKDFPLGEQIAFGIPAVMFVAGTVEIERKKSFVLPRVLQLFGNASYSIYLIHSVILSFALQAVLKVAGFSIPVDVMVFIIAFISIVAGVLYHLYFETRLIGLVRWIFFRHKVRPTRAA